MGIEVPKVGAGGKGATASGSRKNKKLVQISPIRLVNEIGV